MRVKYTQKACYYVSTPIPPRYRFIDDQCSVVERLCYDQAYGDHNAARYTGITALWSSRADYRDYLSTIHKKNKKCGSNEAACFLVRFYWYWFVLLFI